MTPEELKYIKKLLQAEPADLMEEKKRKTKIKWKKRLEDQFFRRD